MKSEDKKKSKKNILLRIVFVLFIVSVFYAVFMFFQAPSGQSEDQFGRVKSDYVLMILQCLAGAVVLFLPSKIKKHSRLYIPNTMEVLYIIFLFCAIFLGEVGNFYHLIPFWDMILHGFSAGMLGALGFMIVTYLNQSDHLEDALTPFFVALFSFGFAMTIGVFWEIYEFAADALLGTNMQKFITANNTVLEGQEALFDTMKDLIINTTGALIICAIGYYLMKKKGTVNLVDELEEEKSEE